MRRKKKKLSEMTISDLESLREKYILDIGYRESLIPSDLDRVKAQFERGRSRNFSEERRRLRQDPRNIIKTGLFGLGLGKWTESCEQQCRAIDAEQAALGQLGSTISEAERNKGFIDELREKLGQVERQLSKLVAQQEVLRRKQLKHNELKLRAKRNEDEVRAMAANTKRSIRAGLSDCPYCGGSLGENPHADHIYPVSKGGLSVETNMVMVCAKCNLKKKDMTLREFIVKFSMNREHIEARLEDLGKAF